MMDDDPLKQESISNDGYFYSSLSASQTDMELAEEDPFSPFSQVKTEQVENVMFHSVEEDKLKAQCVQDHTRLNVVPKCVQQAAQPSYISSHVKSENQIGLPSKSGVIVHPKQTQSHANQGNVYDPLYSVTGAPHRIPSVQQIPDEKTPDKDSMLDFDDMMTTGAGYFSRENFITVPTKCEATDTFSKLSSGPFSRLTHPRKSPPLKRYYRTPSPPRIHAQPPRHNYAIAECYYTGSVHPRPASAMDHALSRTSCETMPTASRGGNPNHCATAMLRSATPNPSTSCAHANKNSITVKSNGITRTIAILNRNRSTSSSASSAAAGAASCGSVGRVVHPQPVKPCVSSTCTSVPAPCTTPTIPVENTQQQGIPSSKEKGESKLNTSLTNIQWLGEMKALDNGSAGGSRSSTSQHHKDIRVMASEKQIAQISAECGRKKRPPYSYMHLIQMAICSKDERHLTLREIYKWIEDKFPYYKFHPNQGWKNSIRHNLSLYDIFIRKKVSVPGKSGTSFWTLREDFGKTGPPLKEEAYSRSPTPEHLLPICDLSKPAGGKKGPVPLLPKPDPNHGYALIPIQGGLPIMSSQPIIVPANWALSHAGQATSTPIADANKSQKRILSSSERSGPQKKQIKIAPKIDLSSFSIFNDSSSQTSWLSTSSTSLSNSQMSSSQLSNVDTSDLRAQLSHLKFVDSGIELSSTTDPDTSAVTGGESESTRVGLPKPKLYTEIKRKKTPRKSKRKQKLPSPSPPPKCSSSLSVDSGMLSNDTGLQNIEQGAEIGDILAGIEKNLTSPVRMLLRTPPKDKDLITSTPFKATLSSPSWISPIRGITPNGGGSNIVVGRGLFTPPPDNANKTSTPLESGKLDTPQHDICTPSSTNQQTAMLTPFSTYACLGASPSLQSTADRSPQLGSLQAFGLAGLTPLKSPITPNSHSPSSGGMITANSSFTKLFGEFHLDNVIMDEVNIDVANFSFSAFHEDS